MRAREILDREAARVEQGQCQRIAECQRRGRARRRGEAERAGFRIDARVQMDVGSLRQRRLFVSGQRDQARALSLEMGQQRHQFVGFAGIRQQKHDIIGGDHSQVTVTSLGGVNEERGRTGRRQRRGDLARNVSGFANTGHNHATAALEQRPCSGKKRRAEAVGEGGNRGGLGREHIATERECTYRVDAARCPPRLLRSLPACEKVYRNAYVAAPGAVLHWADVAHAAADSAAPRRSGGCSHRLPAGASAADSGLPWRWNRGRPACARLGARHGRRARPGRVRHRLPDVLHRPRVQPAAIEDNAPRRVRSGIGAGRDHDAHRDACPAPGRRPLAGRVQPRRRARDELDGDRIQDACRAHGAQHGTWTRHHRDTAFPGSRRGRFPDRDPDAGGWTAPMSGPRWRSPRARPRSPWQ